MIGASYNKVGFPLGAPASIIPVGFITESPISLSDPAWARCDGSIVQRSTYPAFSAGYGTAGVFTPTLRALASTPAASVATIASAGGNTVTVGPTGTAAIQYSSNNGVTWASATTPSSSAPVTIVWTGTNFFATGYPSIGMYSPTATGSGTWTASSGISGSSGTCATNGTGTVIMSNSASGTGYLISTNSGNSFTAGTLAASASTAAATVWTGTQWLVFQASATAGVGLQYSATGASGTWTALVAPPWAAQAVTSAVSDGNSNVMAIIGASSVAYVSNNGGTTWRETLLPQIPTTTSTVSYANGRWLVSISSGGDYVVSSDLYTWMYIPVLGPLGNSAGAVTYSGGNYITMATGIASVTTSTENTSQMYMPTSRRSGTSGQILSVVNWQEWVKVA